MICLIKMRNLIHYAQIFQRVSLNRLILWGVLLVGTNCCRDDKHPDPGPPKQPTEIGKAQVWITSGDQTRLLAKENDISITEVAESDLPTITINESEKLQQIEGFGAALTESSAFLIQQELNSTQRSSLLE